VVERFLEEEMNKNGGSSEAQSDACCGLEIRYLTAVHKRGPAAARNVGWNAARGEIVAFTDDDCVPDPDWLKEGIAVMDQGFAGVSGQVRVPVPDPPTDYEKNISQLETNSEFVTANCFYSCEALEKCDGFDEHFGMAWREDSDLFFRMLAHSFKMGYAPAAVVVHPVRQAPWGVSIKEQRKTQYNALLYKKHPALYRERIQSATPIRYYVILFFLIGAIVMFVFRQWPVAVGMISLWGVLTIQFALQRLKSTKRSLSHVLEMLFTSMVIPPLSIFWRLYGAFYYGVWFL